MLRKDTVIEYHVSIPVLIFVSLRYRVYTNSREKTHSILNSFGSPEPDYPKRNRVGSQKEVSAMRSCLVTMQITCREYCLRDMARTADSFRVPPHSSRRSIVPDYSRSTPVI